MNGLHLGIKDNGATLVGVLIIIVLQGFSVSQDSSEHECEDSGIYVRKDVHDEQHISLVQLITTSEQRIIAALKE